MRREQRRIGDSVKNKFFTHKFVRKHKLEMRKKQRRIGEKWYATRKKDRGVLP